MALSMLTYCIISTSVESSSCNPCADSLRWKEKNSYVTTMLQREREGALYVYSSEHVSLPAYLAHASFDDCQIQFSGRLVGFEGSYAK